ncbi:MAG: phosphocarrier protein HPr [Candidatus Endobugula sp.]|jgi:phosphocarrier protein HPr
MVKQSLTIINKLGLHARAASKLTGVAARFSCMITLDVAGKTVDCKSVMALMLLAASKGTDVKITADGSDEAEAISAVSALINNRFDEAE